MTELDVIAALRPRMALPSSEELAVARRPLTAAIDAEAPSSVVPGRPRSWTPVGRLALVGAVAAAVAGLVLVVVPGAPTPGRSPTDRPPVHLTAVQFLHQAAAAVLQGTTATPQSNQFVYSQTENPDGTLNDTWLSVDGGRPGLTSGDSASAANTIPACTVVQAETARCYPEAGYLPDMPIDPNMMLAYLNKVQIVDTVGQADDSLPGWEDNVIGKAVMYLMETTYLLPAQQAALYDLMAQTPGFAIVPALTDAIGRTGVGIEWTFQGDTAAVIFDPVTYAFLGARTWPGPPDVNTAYDGSALVKVAIVDNRGQLPS
jgi:hypothetical protein